MSNTSENQTTEPPGTVSGAAIPGHGPDADNETVLEIIRTARGQLVQVEMILRDLWYDTVDSRPDLSARLNIAARLVHNAAEALSPQTLF